MKPGTDDSVAQKLAPRDSDIVELVDVAARQEKLTGLADVLKVLAGALDSDACIAWEQAPSGSLFVLGAFLPQNWTPAIYYLGPESVTVSAIKSGQTVSVAGIPQGVRDHNASASRFMEVNGIRSFATSPIVIRQRVQGAISVYRTSEAAYSEPELVRLKELAGVIPNLYTALVDRVGFQLLADTHPLGQFPKQVEEALEPVVNTVASMMNCREASIFLEDYFDDPGEYRLKACVWSWPDEKPALGSPVPEEGATRYAVSNNRTVHLLDLADLGEIEDRHPGLVWKDNLKLYEVASRILPRGPGGELQPLTFVATPIRGVRGLLGVIRCGVANSAPFYFDARSVQFLELLAERLGVWWERYLDARQDKREVELWRRLADKVPEMNNFVLDELARDQPDEKHIFRRALDLVREVFADCSAFAVRLQDVERNHLYFADTAGPLWDKYALLGESPRNRTYSLVGPPNSAGALVWQNRDVYMTEDPWKDKLTVVIFPETTREIAAAIAAGEHMYGVLDIISSSKRPFGENAKAVAKLLGRQIGLYHHLALRIAEIRNLQKAELDRADKDRKAELDRVEKERKTYENFEHQIRTPVMMALRRASELVKSHRATRHLDPQLLTLRSLCRQADRVAKNLRFFAQLTDERPVTLRDDKLSTLTTTEVLEFLREAAGDQRLIAPSRRQLDFAVDEKSFDELYRMTVQADWDLLEQAVGNLLDNAGKYSYKGSRVRVSGGATRRGEYFYISVSNRGYPIKEPSKLAVRGYRADEAQGSDGSGIGLWIVKKIMLAHKGFLEIIPTTEQGINDFRLLFPKLKTGAKS